MKNFDELLDEVLREDGKVMPRPGLETRVMARLRADERPAWRGWMSGAMVAAACVMAAVVWIAPRNGPAPKVEDHVASTEQSSQPEPGRSARVSRDIPFASWQGTHLSDDKTVAKVGHPAAVERAAEAAPKVRRSLVVAQQNPLPKLATFPAVTQKGDAMGWWSSDDGGKLAALAKESSPATVAAFQELRSVQDRPIDIAAIEIKPLQ
ncbi:MAG TPA: hypothetical protein VFE38_13880 [Edaphobacter sp.]|nr:hypothetical protein [Edaphobacter sp.]